MEIDTKGIYEISKNKNKVIFIYKTEDDAMHTIMKIHKEGGKEINKLFPEGVF